MIRIFVMLCTVVALVSGAAEAGNTPSRPGAKVYFINLEDGATVSSPVFLQFGVSNMGVAPAGTQRDFTGHHHIVINDALEPRDFNRPLPSNANIKNLRKMLSGLLRSAHVHFGGGQTEVMLDLPPGEHTLQLVFADWTHIPHDPPLTSERITITVE